MSKAWNASGGLEVCFQTIFRVLILIWVFVYSFILLQRSTLYFTILVYVANEKILSLIMFKSQQYKLFSVLERSLSKYIAHHKKTFTLKYLENILSTHSPISTLQYLKPTHPIILTLEISSRNILFMTKKLFFNI